MSDMSSHLPAASNPAQPVRCRHIKVDGTQCGCPALRGRLLCHFHFNWHLSTSSTPDSFARYVDDYRDKHPRDFVRDRLIPPSQRDKEQQEELLQNNFIREQCENAADLMPILEDANSVQVALMKIMRLLLAQAIPYKTASLLLYALQTASGNLRHTNFAPPSDQVMTAPFRAPVDLPNKGNEKDNEAAETQTNQSQRASDEPPDAHQH